MNSDQLLLDINENPFRIFNGWFEDAKQNEINDPNAMNLATVGDDQYPSSRMVLLKSHNSSGFVFYTNLNSKKGNQIKNNSKVGLNFYWKSLLKQVRIQGRAKVIKNNESDAYFNSRSENSRIGAWASIQSSYLINRVELEKKVEEFKKRFEGKKIPRPSYWVGIRVEPELIEFWQHMPFRLHDRVEYVKSEKGWIGRRLYP